MIFVAAGTQDGRGLVEYLLRHNYQVHASVATDYGRCLLPEHPHLTINEGKLDQAELKAYIKRHGLKCFVDATHPYAVNISNNAMQVCEELNIPYIRYERAVTPLPTYDKIHLVPSYEEACKLSMELGKVVFLTTGSNRLQDFTEAAKIANNTVIARVIPSIESLQICQNAGVLPRNIIAMQGPFSEELNTAMYKRYHSEVVVMKNSGTLGGTETKLLAAIKLGLHIVIIDRPHINYRNLMHSYPEVLELIQDNLGTTN